VSIAEGNALKSASRLDQYRRVLEQKAEEVRAGLSARRAAEVVLRLEEPLDFGDWCQKNHDEWLFLNQNRLEIALLRNLEAALDRLARGAYGTCPSCHEPISPKRLEAVPWAEFCVRCEEQAAAAAAGEVSAGHNLVE
jgi:DnaK suppressor protein